MSGQLRSELLKLRTTRTVALLLLASAALAAFGVSVEALSTSTRELAREATQRELLTGGTSGVFFATLAGLLAVTSEFRYGTIRPTLLVEPRRRVVLAAKLTTAALAGVLFAGICVAVSFAIGPAILAWRDVGFAVTSAHVLTLIFGSIGAGVLSAMVGVAVGTLIRNQAGAIVALAAYAVAVDAALFAAAPSVGRYLPGKAGDALAGRAVEHLLTPGVGAVVLAAWALAFVVAAAWRTAHTDV